MSSFRFIKYFYTVYPSLVAIDTVHKQNDAERPTIHLPAIASMTWEKKKHKRTYNISA